MIALTLLTSCAATTPPTPAPAPAAAPEVPACGSPALDTTPDLSPYQRLELTSNANGTVISRSLKFVADGSYLEVSADASAASERLYVQPEECRNSADESCARHFVALGNLTAFGTHVKCYVQLRNDSNTGYCGQAIAGLCQDAYSRSFSAVLSK
jgi:hypothetical protein